ncbi:hypothetical protein C8J57DRAFT_529389 [Mycena rebaudengoi]|nr:hypothetical protein C8J57DRAFT_529389 [Mycena rebaudengoi]
MWRTVLVLRRLLLPWLDSVSSPPLPAARLRAALLGMRPVCTSFLRLLRRYCLIISAVDQSSGKRFRVRYGSAMRVWKYRSWLHLGSDNRL